MKSSTYFDHFHKVSWKSISIYLLSLFNSAPYKWIQGSQGDEACKCFCLRLLHVCVAALVAALILVQQCWLTEENTYLRAPLVAFGSSTHAFLLYYPTTEPNVRLWASQQTVDIEGCHLQLIIRRRSTRWTPLQKCYWASPRGAFAQLVWWFSTRWQWKNFQKHVVSWSSKWHFVAS